MRFSGFGFVRDILAVWWSYESMTVVVELSLVSPSPNSLCTY